MTATTPVLDAPVAASDHTGAGNAKPPAWWGRLEVWLGVLVVVACCAFILVQLDPKLLLRNTTPNGGDTGAHVWWPAYLRDHLLPWRLAGWAPDWFAGFPAGQFYFPLPAVLIVALNTVIPYNVAFKLITALGPLLLPVGAYVFARGLRAPNPAPAALAVAATGFLFFNGDPGTSQTDKAIAGNQHIMGGNLASNLAGEFSFTLALALALCFLGALAWALRTRRGLWLPAALLAATAMSHLVVAVFAVVGAAVVVVGTRTRPPASLRTAGRVAAVLVGLTGLAVLVAIGAGNLLVAGYVVVLVVVVLVAVWPAQTITRAAAIGGVAALVTAAWTLPLVTTLQYTTDMRYGAIGVRSASNPDGAHQYVQYLFPWSYLWGVRGVAPWQWGATALAVIAIVGGVLGRRRSTLVIVTLTALAGLMFRIWADVQATPAWNLRVLPFWYLCVFLLMGLGVAELVLGAAWLVRRGARRRAARARAAGSHWRWLAATPRVAMIGTALTLTTILAVGALVNIDAEKDFLPFWVKWNESGYQDTRGDGGLKKAYGEYRRLIDTIGRLPAGRVQWEGGQALDNYGTPLALMLLPYWTHGRFPSMEGLYYESTATTPYVFMTAATIAGSGNASNPVRGIPYRSIVDFSLGVRWLQLLGVRYYVAHSQGAHAAADHDARLQRVATSPVSGGISPESWVVYRVADSATVVPLADQPVVVDSLSSAERTACRRQVIVNGIEPSQVTLHDWQDCIAVPWFNDPTGLDRPLIADGPSSWQHAQPTAAMALPKRPLPAVTVTRIRQSDRGVSFHVSRTGVPVLVKISYFPNWQVHGARGVYRSTPNFMVVVPTSRDVRLTYGTTGVEWLGRVLTVFGFLGLGGLAWWGRRSRRRRRRPVG